MTDTSALWEATDLLTQPTRHRLTRSDAASSEDAETETAADFLQSLATDPTRNLCHVADYRRAVRRLGLQATRTAVIPSLWEQAEQAVSGIGDQDGGGSRPARERSVADLALMETLVQVRETLAAELAERHLAPRTTVPAQIRQVASNVAADNDPETLAWWTWRIEHWVRVITAQLNAADHAPRPVRVRDAPCPACGVRQIRVHEQGETRLVPPLRIDFRQGQIRAAECGGCGKSWFRGEALWELADALAQQIIATAS